MAKKQKTAARKRPPAAAKKAAATADSGPEFLVVRIGNLLKVGANMTVLGVTGSLQEARKMVDSMVNAAPTRVAILEKKVVLKRAPKITVLEETCNIISK